MAHDFLSRLEALGVARQPTPGEQGTPQGSGGGFFNTLQDIGAVLQRPVNPQATQQLQQRRHLEAAGLNTPQLIGGRINDILNAGGTPQQTAGALAELGVPEALLLSQKILQDVPTSAQRRTADIAERGLGLREREAAARERELTRAESAERRAEAADTSGILANLSPVAKKEFRKVKGRNLAEKVSNFQSQLNKLPELTKTIDKLKALAPKVTFRKAGQISDTVRRELGLPISEGAIARADFISTINNQVLPLLRDTFGAAFTEREGQTLRDTMGDPDLSPEEKLVVLNSFINQKTASLVSMGRELGINTEGLQPAPVAPTAPTVPGQVINFGDLPK